MPIWLASDPGRIFTPRALLLRLIALGQRISLLQWDGMLAVTAASIGATCIRRRPAEVPPPGLTLLPTPAATAVTARRRR